MTHSAEIFHATQNSWFFNIFQSTVTPHEDSRHRAKTISREGGWETWHRHSFIPARLRPRQHQEKEEPKTNCKCTMQKKATAGIFNCFPNFY